jgi:hypothetical protein
MFGLYIAWNFVGAMCSTCPSVASGCQHCSRSRSVAWNLWTSGGYRPEGGLLGTFALILGSVCILTWDRWRGPIKLHQMLVQPPAWARAGDT